MLCISDTVMLFAVSLPITPLQWCYGLAHTRESLITFGAIAMFTCVVCLLRDQFGGGAPAQQHAAGGLASGDHAGEQGPPGVMFPTWPASCVMLRVSQHTFRDGQAQLQPLTILPD